MYVAWCNEWCYKQGIAEGLHQTIWQMCRDVGFLMIRFRTAARYLTWQRNHYQSQPHLLITCCRHMELILQGLTDEGRGCDPLEIVVLSDYRDTFPFASGWTMGKDHQLTVLWKSALDPLKALLVSYSEKILQAMSLKAVKKHTGRDLELVAEFFIARDSPARTGKDLELTADAFLSATGGPAHTQGDTLSSSQILSSSPRTAARHTQGQISSSSQVPSSSPGMAPTQIVASSSSQIFSSSPETAPHTQGTTSSSSQISSSSPGMASSRRTWKSAQFRNTTADDSDQCAFDHHQKLAGLNVKPGLRDSIADHLFGAQAYLQYHEDLASHGLFIVGEGKFDLCMYLMKAIQDRNFASRLAALLAAAMPDVYTD
eukprot:TRINITY_DN7027_c0_g1_i6.p1 TRINITY_DN7027_c0_g1~~TRINITY_DN7027_c0_g1_i6.p1  ORF type:complete len:372 (+),score=38.78 TRINITY_DN7027_c0_g1_i6:281-1396(+)